MCPLPLVRGVSVCHILFTSVISRGVSRVLPLVIAAVVILSCPGALFWSIFVIAFSSSLFDICLSFRLSGSDSLFSSFWFVLDLSALACCFVVCGGVGQGRVACLCFLAAGSWFSDISV